MTLPVINSVEQYPIPIASPFGEWMERSNLEDHWKADPSFHPAQIALVHLKATYGDDETAGELLPGDPRNYLAEEICFVAVRSDGVIGIHTEVELEEEFNDLDDPSKFEDEVTREEFNDIAELYSGKLASLVEKFPKSDFFISHGDSVTYKGRICLNAFTPLVNTEQVLAMITAYQSPENIGKPCPTILALADDLISIILE